LVNKEILLLTDYKGNFLNKWGAVPYRSGFDKEYLKKQFKKNGYELTIKKISEINILNNDFNDLPILYSSSEEYGRYYKSYIEDIVYSLKLSGANLIPSFELLKAHDNKVFMETLRKVKLPDEAQKLGSISFGCYEDLLGYLKHDTFDYPCVVKESVGAMSTGVYLAKSESHLKKIAKNISYTAPVKVKIKEKIRGVKYSGYKQESFYQNKFIVQEFIPNLKNDWKVLIFGERYFIFKRPTRKNDFRASGSGSENYLYAKNAEPPKGLFDFASEIFSKFETPTLSLDVCFDGEKFYLIEFQAINFGTVGVIKSNGYYQKNSQTWEYRKSTLELESLFVDSVMNYLAQLK